jgi:hypothetical protein
MPQQLAGFSSVAKLGGGSGETRPQAQTILLAARY